eukprot:gnl/Spiro4/25057_TR12462_c0_g1_i1.p1 gnl/Spiro4/25057_TR12462_c0_g1~~gnl/Spiro4/25057_TR12462_c0_g1_i1.p1  ORF type:complete len:311 (-),score=59.97 gnl/Spiro4/25057_TR12462_c0_g1_i1:136-1068(-)
MGCKDSKPTLKQNNPRTLDEEQKEMERISGWLKKTTSLAKAASSAGDVEAMKQQLLETMKLVEGQSVDLVKAERQVVARKRTIADHVTETERLNQTLKAPANSGSGVGGGSSEVQSAKIELLMMDRAVQLKTLELAHEAASASLNVRRSSVLLLSSHAEALVERWPELRALHTQLVSNNSAVVAACKQRTTATAASSRASSSASTSTFVLPPRVAAIISTSASKSARSHTSSRSHRGQSHNNSTQATSPPMSPSMSPSSSATPLPTSARSRVQSTDTSFSPTASPSLNPTGSPGKPSRARRRVPRKPPEA